MFRQLSFFSIIQQQQLKLAFILVNCLCARTLSLNQEDLPPLTISFNPPADRVLVDRPLRISCEYTPPTSSLLDSIDSVDHTQLSMELYCPFSTGDVFCFQNCQSVCSGQSVRECPNAKDLSLIQCSHRVTNNGKVTVEYIIPQLSPKWISWTLSPTGELNGGFFCKLGLYKTPEVGLIKSVVTPKPKATPAPPPPQPPPTPRKTPTTTSKRPTAKPNDLRPRNSDPLHPGHPVTPRPGNRESDLDAKSELHRFFCVN